MEKLEVFNQYFNHMMWADVEIWKKILSFEAAQTDKRIKDLLYHIHSVQYAFYFVWNILPSEIPKAEEFRDFKSIATWGREYQKKLKTFLQSQTDENLEKPINIPWSKYLERKIGNKVVPATIKENLIQVTSHTSYHRGQINSRIRELGGEPPTVDFIIWAWINKPQADWAFLDLES